MGRRFTQPREKTAARRLTRVANAKLDEPLAGSLVDLRVHFSSICCRIWKSAFTRYFFAIGNEMPSSLLICSSDSP